MDLDLSTQDTGFRDEVRAFLNDNLPDDIKQAEYLGSTIMIDHEPLQRWHQILNARGWAAPNWPEGFGGTGWSVVERYVFESEYARAGAPRLSPLGIGMVGPVIIGHGTQEQQNNYLPRILSGEDVWCQGYSEPGSGSDLASLQTRAVKDGDDYIVNGTKIWTTNAHNANHIFCLVRTDPDVRKQEGITFLLIDMDTPGIKVKPIINIADDHEFNQVFFDDVRVPQQNRVGAENNGWTVAKYLLEFERGGGAFAAKLRALLDEVRLVADATGSSGGRLADDSDFSRRFADIGIMLTGVEYTEHRAIAEIAERGRPGPTSSMLKLKRTEMTQAIGELAKDAVAYYGAPHQPEARKPGANVDLVTSFQELPVMPRYLNDRYHGIAGGSDEIQHNIVAKMILGM
jgi:alkylation response protein AidB-like acyl-CoA dehydrogenase